MHFISMKMVAKRYAIHGSKNVLQIILFIYMANNPQCVCKSRTERR